jgi:CheY-like chemotaxis protein
VFQEVHRLKGAGGTYGFHEISFLYEDIIECIRPAHQEKRLPDPEEIEKAAADARLFREYLPVLLGAFKDLNSDDSPSTPALFYVTYARSNMFSHFHLFAIRSRLPIFSVINAGEARFALEHIRPAYAVLDVKLPDGNGTALLQQILSKYPDVKGFILSAAHSESERRESISSGALDYWSVKTPAQYILKQVEKHVHKR